MERHWRLVQQPWSPSEILDSLGMCQDDAKREGQVHF